MNPIDLNGSLASIRRILAANLTEQARSTEWLATGLRINAGRDDPAGLVASETLRAQIAALEAESRSAQRADHAIATADGALGEISALLVEAEALAVANAGGAGLSEEERQANQMELNSITGAINRIAASASFNGDPLLDGTASFTVADETLTIDAIAAPDLDIVAGDVGDARTRLRALRNDVLARRAALGAFSRHTIQARVAGIGVAIENLSAAESAIRDTDYAREISRLAQLQVLAGAAGRAFEMTAAERGRIVELFA